MTEEYNPKILMNIKQFIKKNGYEKYKIYKYDNTWNILFDITKELEDYDEPYLFITEKTKIIDSKTLPKERFEDIDEDSIFIETFMTHFITTIIIHHAPHIGG
jgi:hypothetical protein